LIDGLMSRSIDWLCTITGLRWACLCSSGLIALGSALRCVTDDPYAAKWQVNWTLRLVIAVMVCMYSI